MSRTHFPPALGTRPYLLYLTLPPSTFIRIYSTSRSLILCTGYERHLGYDSFNIHITFARGHGYDCLADGQGSRGISSIRRQDHHELQCRLSLPNCPGVVNDKLPLPIPSHSTHPFSWPPSPSHNNTTAHPPRALVPLIIHMIIPTTSTLHRHRRRPDERFYGFRHRGHGVSGQLWLSVPGAWESAWGLDWELLPLRIPGMGEALLLEDW